MVASSWIWYMRKVELIDLTNGLDVGCERMC